MKFKIIVCFLVLLLMGCNDNELSIITEIPLNKGGNLRVYYYGGHATAPYTIQLKRVNNSNEELLKVFVNYDSLMTYTLLGKDSIKLVLSDKDACKYFGCKQDTFYVKY